MTQISGYAQGSKHSKWIRVITMQASSLVDFLKAIPQDTLILTIYPLNIGGRAYRRLVVDIEKSELKDEKTFHIDDEGFDFRSMMKTPGSKVS